jgi:hypothetical protein
MTEKIRDMPPAEQKKDPDLFWKMLTYASNTCGLDMPVGPPSLINKVRAGLRAAAAAKRPIDPETAGAGIGLARFHIRQGAKTIPEFADRMISDCGAAIRPYLLTFYEAIRYWPDTDTSGMTTTGDAKILLDRMRV